MKPIFNLIIFKRLSLLGALACFVTTFSCNPNPNDDITRIVPTDSIVNLDIKTVKSFYHGEDIRLDQHNNFKEINIYGSLISDPKTYNTPKGILVLQQKDVGIALQFTDSMKESSFILNEILQVNIKKGTISKINGNLTITGLSFSDVTSTGEVDSIAPRSVTLKELSKNFKDFNETLVKINLAGIVPHPVSGDTYEGVKKLDDGSTEAGAVTLYTFPHSGLAEERVRPNATYTAIAMYNKALEDSLEKQIWLRNIDDIDSTKIVPVHSPFIITGFLANPTGWDQINPGVGYFPSYLNRAVEGGFEYIQFMALKDIDFSKTPFSLVLMVSYEGRPGATADGWTAGGFRTAKFELTSGTASQGTFFYVGSGEELIDGFSPAGLSTDISNANWIKSTPWWLHDYDDEIGDPFSNGNIGHGLHSWLDNRTEPGSDAIAIFEGTTVTPMSVPVDAIFLNENIGGTIDRTNGFGFSVPDNDLYSSVNTNTNAPQPLFGEGSNTYAVPISIVNGDGVWVALGGIVTEDGFIGKRDHPIGIQLYVDPGRSSISDIEEGKGITIFRN